MLRLRHNPPIRCIRFGRLCRTARFIPVVARRIEFLFYNSNPAALRDATPPLFGKFVPLREHGTRRHASLLFDGVHIFCILTFTAALRDATPPLFRQFVPMREHGTFRYGSVLSGHRPDVSSSFRFGLIFAAALRDATPPLFRQIVPSPKRGTSRYVCAHSGRRRFFHCLSLGYAAAMRDVAPPQFSSRDSRFSDTAYSDADDYSVGSFRVSSLPDRRTRSSGYPFFGGGGRSRSRLGADRISAARPRSFRYFGFGFDIRLRPEGAKTGYFTSAPRPAARRIPEGAGFYSTISSSLPFFCESTTFITSGFIIFGEPVDGGCFIALFSVPAFRPGRSDRGRGAE